VENTREHLTTASSNGLGFTNRTNKTREGEEKKPFHNRPPVYPRSAVRKEKKVVFSSSQEKGGCWDLDLQL